MQFELQQGHEDPRSGELLWTAHDIFDDKNAAIAAAPNHGIWRVVQVTPVWLNEEAEGYS